MADWDRSFFRPGGGDAFISYLIFGQFGQMAACSASRYDTAGLPAGVEVAMRLRTERPDAFQPWESGTFGMQLREAGLFEAVADAPAMLQLQGSVSDPGSLAYLRDSIGVAKCLLDQGGVAILDPQALKWWTPPAWTAQIFDAHEPQPRQHAVILVSEDEGDPSLNWYHTRGMRKFARPDLSIHAVPRDLEPAVIDLLNRFIEMEAFGAIVEDGQPIRMASLPDGLTCHPQGDFDDPAFNNVHIEIAWPAR